MCIVYVVYTIFLDGLRDRMTSTSGIQIVRIIERGFSVLWTLCAHRGVSVVVLGNQKLVVKMH